MHIGFFSDVPAIVRIHRSRARSSVSCSFLHNFNVPRSVKPPDVREKYFAAAVCFATFMRISNKYMAEDAYIPISTLHLTAVTTHRVLNLPSTQRRPRKPTCTGG